MVCEKLKYYDDLKDILDNYDKYIDFQYIAVNNIRSPLEFREKLKFFEEYKTIFGQSKRNKRKIL